MPVILALAKLEWRDCECQARLIYITEPCLHQREGRKGGGREREEGQRWGRGGTYLKLPCMASIWSWVLDWFCHNPELSMRLQCVGFYKLLALNVIETMDRPQCVRKKPMDMVVTGLDLCDRNTVHTVLVESKERSWPEYEPSPS